MPVRYVAPPAVEALGSQGVVLRASLGGGSTTGRLAGNLHG